MADFTLCVRPPFRLDLTAWVLRRLPTNMVDAVEGGAWSRVIVAGGRACETTVIQEGPVEEPALRVMVRTSRLSARAQSAISATVARMLGLGVDLSGFHAMAAHDTALGPLVARFRGMRPPRMASVFEAFVNAVSCQQITLVLGLTLLNRLAKALGPEAGGRHALPGPEALAAAQPEELRALGYSGNKARYLIGAAREVAEGRLDLEALAGKDDETVIERLRRIAGVGRWTAEYVALRGLGRLAVFPGDDVGGQRRIQAWMGLAERPGYDEVRRILERLRPYAGLLYFYLLLDGLQRKGYVA